MTDPPDPGELDPEKRLSDKTGVRSEAWEQTNEEMDLLAEERREDGWNVVSIPAVHTSTLTRQMGDTDEFGIEYVIPDNYAEEFAETFDPDAFTQYQVYRTVADQNVFQVIELLAPETETAIMIAGMYELQLAGGMVKAAMDEQELYTFVRTIDGTRLGMLRHDDFEPLIPRTGVN
jgi:hypothetical protein